MLMNEQIALKMQATIYFNSFKRPQIIIEKTGLLQIQAMYFEFQSQNL